MESITFDLSTLTLGEAAEIEMASGKSLQELLKSKGGGPPNGGIRPTIAQLREHAELVRSIEPPAARRHILDLALILGRDTREVASWTYGDAHYIVRTTNERLQRVSSGARR
jgi:hypothetical protein